MYKYIIYIKVFKAMLDTAVHEVKTLQRDTKDWYESSCDPTYLYLDNPVNVIPSVKGKTSKLIIKNGITKVEDLMMVDTNKIECITNSMYYRDLE